MEAFRGLSNSELRALIDETIRGPHGQRNRQLTKRRLIDGLTYESLAEEAGMSPVQIKRIVQRCMAELAQK